MATLRADAERNRHQLLESARRVFAERGLDAPLDDIARRAGVGNATLYRRFPSRHDLVGAVFSDTLEQICEAARRALVAPDAWPAFAEHLTFLCALQAENRALADLLTTRVAAPGLEALRGQALDLLVQLIDRARLAGELRADFTHEDVVVLLMANAGLLERTSQDAPTAWRRHLAHVLDGLRTDHPTVVAPPTREQILQAMATAASRRGCS
ncbi:MAG: TetR/AcrR family transcriptional regulator [Janthinobacterium lividum]